ncbi:uncharacterized protein LODBEIA_P24080 [Lodderomyces beijingensis]|uniref:DASH complex subunit DAD4 n=1 Tax=Lodderomyces beijingensis TaxID=1775926 RepID=A0ABP0ZJ68_9ASCO
MENPHEQIHKTLLARIINNVENLNESIVDMNKMLQQANRNNLDNEIIASMWESYIRSAEYNLQATGNKSQDDDDAGDEDVSGSQREN